MSEPLGMKIELLETNSSIQYPSRQSSRAGYPSCTNRDHLSKGQSETAASTAALPPRAVVAALGSSTHFMLHTIFTKLTQKSAVELVSKGGTRGGKGRQRGEAVGAAVGAANICGGGTFPFWVGSWGRQCNYVTKGGICMHAFWLRCKLLASTPVLSLGINLSGIPNLGEEVDITLFSVTKVPPLGAALGRHFAFAGAAVRHLRAALGGGRGAALTARRQYWRHFHRALVEVRGLHHRSLDLGICTFTSHLRSCFFAPLPLRFQIQLTQPRHARAGGEFLFYDPIVGTPWRSSVHGNGTPRAVDPHRQSGTHRQRICRHCSLRENNSTFDAVSSVHFHDKAGRRLELRSSLNQHGHAGFVEFALRWLEKDRLESLASKQYEDAKKRLNCWRIVFRFTCIKFVPGRSRERMKAPRRTCGDRASREGERDTSRRVQKERRGKGRGGKGSDECHEKGAAARRGKGTARTNEAGDGEEDRVGLREGEREDSTGRQGMESADRKAGYGAGACRAAAACIKPEAWSWKGRGRSKGQGRHESRHSASAYSVECGRGEAEGRKDGRDRARGVGYETTSEPGGAPAGDRARQFEEEGRSR
ncbi:hypothetical protein DFH08DRAFT_827973 [Mycena albidolilacea]|uniref:Uncharacterized protein n=1 Tax=Mycena albidolilacea TaxID=1033008 RepID=A0AAD6YWZ8_9AGAR|nr:hypothetical protein DFH08DRAFT_827973 [Mycena albidolilacea]